MIFYFFRWLFGYVEFKFEKGFAEGFINECFNKEISIKKVVRTDFGITAYARINTYKSLHKIAYNNGGTVKIIKKHGLPFLLKPLRNRWGFFCGIFVFILIISILSSFVWNVEIIGCDRVNKGEVLEVLEQNGVKEGRAWSSFDKNDIGYLLMAQFDDISWSYINRKGSTAEVMINESVLPPSNISEDKKGNHGIERKEINLTVSRTQCNEILRDEKEYKSLYFYSIEIPLYFKKNKGREEKEIDYLEIFDKKLPIAVIEYNEKYYIKDEYSLTDEALLSLAKKRLNSARDEKFSDCKIINENIKTKINEDNCEISGAYVVRY